MTPDSISNVLLEWLEIASEAGERRFSEALVKAVRSSEFFPSVFLIRKCAGLDAETAANCEADQAWDMVQRHIDKWYGRPETPPRAPDERIDYAVRAVGGIPAIANAKLDSLPFIRRDFAEAFARAPFSGLHPLELSKHLPTRQLAGFHTTLQSQTKRFDDPDCEGSFDPR